MFTVNTIFFSLYCLLFCINMFVEIKALLCLCYRILDQEIKFLCPCLCLCICMSFLRNASNRLCMNKCTAQYDVRSPHTTGLPRYARLLCGPTLTHYARRYMSNGIIHVQQSFREIAKCVKQLLIG